jgi:hypothetical protein
MFLQAAGTSYEEFYSQPPKKQQEMTLNTQKV